MEKIGIIKSNATDKTIGGGIIPSTVTITFSFQLNWASLHLKGVNRLED